MKELPEGWEVVPIGTITEVVGGSTPKTSIPEYWDGDIRWITPNDLSGYNAKHIDRGERSITKLGYDSCSTRLVPKGTVLFSSRAPIGYVAIASGPVCTNQGFKSFVPSARVSSDYLYWYLKHATWAIRDMASGTTFSEVSGKVAKTIPVVLAQLAEQQRIVEAIEEQFSRLDAGVESLQRAKRKLIRLRASILTAAVSGRLVGRRSDADWQWMRLGELVENHDAERVPVKAGNRDKRRGQFPYYGAQGIIDTIDDFLFDGDFLLIAEDGANLLSRSKPLAFLASGRFWVNNHAHVVRPHDGVRREFIAIALNAMDISRYVTGSAQPKLTQANLNRLRVPVPPEPEQLRIVAEVERQFSIIDAIAKTIDAGLQRADALRQSILTQAFAGRLVVAP